MYLHEVISAMDRLTAHTTFKGDVKRDIGRLQSATGEDVFLWGCNEDGTVMVQVRADGEPVDNLKLWLTAHDCFNGRMAWHYLTRDRLDYLTTDRAHAVVQYEANRPGAVLPLGRVAAY